MDYSPSDHSLVTMNVPESNSSFVAETTPLTTPATTTTTTTTTTQTSSSSSSPSSSPSPNRVWTVHLPIDDYIIRATFDWIVRPTQSTLQSLRSLCRGLMEGLVEPILDPVDLCEFCVGLLVVERVISVSTTTATTSTTPYGGSTSSISSSIWFFPSTSWDDGTHQQHHYSDGGGRDLPSYSFSASPSLDGFHAKLRELATTLHFGMLFDSNNDNSNNSNNIGMCGIGDNNVDDSYDGGISDGTNLGCRSPLDLLLGFTGPPNDAGNNNSYDQYGGSDTTLDGLYPPWIVKFLFYIMIFACLANSCYFTTLLAPIYNTISRQRRRRYNPSYYHDSYSEGSNNATMICCCLVALFVLEGLMVLAILAVGCCTAVVHPSLVSSTTTTAPPTTGAMMTDETTSTTTTTTTGDMMSDFGLMEDRIQLLVLCTVAWVACVMTSNVLRMSLYHLLGD